MLNDYKYLFFYMIHFINYIILRLLLCCKLGNGHNDKQQYA